MLQRRCFSIITTSLMLGTSLTASFAEDQPGNPRIPSGAAVPSNFPKTIPSAEELKALEQEYANKPQPEAIRMLLAISRGARMGANDGWFGPGESRFEWKWLTEANGVAGARAIPKDKFKGSDLWFSRLDRNKDGAITEEDLDWSDSNQWVQQSYMVNRLFRKMEANGDGALTKEEWSKFFDQAAGGKDQLNSEQLRDAFLSGNSGGYLPGDAPTPDLLMRGLLSSEVGSLHEGPPLNSAAPDFELRTHDGARTVRLSELIGKKPVVLTFGNFTCGPFRSLFPGVEEIHKRFGEEATFVMVYVREAHPTDGWKMESNRRVGVAVAQPKTLAERTQVATQCHALLKPAMPLLVDDINDPVGNAYSGMPARLYVIDLNGKVAYKSGRGPFGFKSGEMEQALVMTLMSERGPGNTEKKQAAK